MENACLGMPAVLLPALTVSLNSEQWDDINNCHSENLPSAHAWVEKVDTPRFKTFVHQLCVFSHAILPLCYFHSLSFNMRSACDVLGTGKIFNSLPTHLNT